MLKYGDVKIGDKVIIKTGLNKGREVTVKSVLIHYVLVSGEMIDNRKPNGIKDSAMLKYGSIKLIK